MESMPLTRPTKNKRRCYPLYIILRSLLAHLLHMMYLLRDRVETVYCNTQFLLYFLFEKPLYEIRVVHALINKNTSTSLF
jgi:hypothetical protein